MIEYENRIKTGGESTLGKSSEKNYNLKKTVEKVKLKEELNNKKELLTNK